MMTNADGGQNGLRSSSMCDNRECSMMTTTVRDNVFIFHHRRLCLVHSVLFNRHIDGGGGGRG